MLLNMPHDPPFHNEILVPQLPVGTSQVVWPTWEEIPWEKQDKFLIQVRNALARKKPFDHLSFPSN